MLENKKNVFYPDYSNVANRLSLHLLVFVTNALFHIKFFRRKCNELFVASV